MNARLRARTGPENPDTLLAEFQAGGRTKRKVMTRALRLRYLLLEDRIVRQQVSASTLQEGDTNTSMAGLAKKTGGRVCV